jgi:hypothetical protein
MDFWKTAMKAAILFLGAVASIATILQYLEQSQWLRRLPVMNQTLLSGVFNLCLILQSLFDLAAGHRGIQTNRHSQSFEGSWRVVHADRDGTYGQAVE